MASNEGSWQPFWVRGGKVTEAVWIGKDVLAWSSGLFLITFNMSQKRESLRWLPRGEHTKGIACLAGHPTIYLLAFADMSIGHQTIHVHLYPSMKKVCECAEVFETEYLATAFTPTDYLVSLGSSPRYTLSIWSWRTGDKLSAIDTSITDIHAQILRVTRSYPVLIAQLGQPSGQLHVWEMSSAGKTIILGNSEVKLPKKALAHHMDWSPGVGDHILAVVDKSGHIYLCDQDGSNVRRIVLSQRCGICLDYEAPAILWFDDGIVLRTTFCQIRFYKKDPTDDLWRKQWYVKSRFKPTTLNPNPSRRDQIFYHTEEGFLMELTVLEDQDSPVIERRMYHGGVFTFADLVRPWGHYLIAMDDSKEVTVMDCYDGEQVSRVGLGLDGEATVLSTHPDVPMAAITSKNGELVILSLRIPENPFVIGKFHLQRERLDLVKFSQSGRHLVVGQRTSGACYCISLTKDKPFEVVAGVETKCRMADVLFYDDGGDPKLLVLVVTSRRVPVGRHLVVYDVRYGQRGLIEATRYLELPYAYQFLHYSPQGVHNVIGTPYLSRWVHVLEIRDWEQVLLLEAMASGHLVRRPRLCVDRRWITSAAFDGMVNLRRGRAPETQSTLMTHHRRELGAVKAVVQPSGDVLVALGHNGSLVGMKRYHEDSERGAEDYANSCRVDFSLYERRKRSILADCSSLDPGFIEMPGKKVEGLLDETKGVNGKTWVERSAEEEFSKDARECSTERKILQEDFLKLREKVAKLLDENEACSEIETLPVSAFDLDKASRDQRVKSARDEIEDAKVELEHSCVSMDRVASWIKQTFRDLEKIPGQSITPIFGSEEITNYNLASDTPEIEDMLRLARLFWHSKRTSSTWETFDSAKLYILSKSHLTLAKRFDSVDEKRRMDALLEADDEEEHEIEPKEIEDQLAKEGMTTGRFVETSNHYYSQFEEHGFSQLLEDAENISEDCRRLREHFNKLFLAMHETKRREIKVIRERHERIRFIDSEMRLMFGQSVEELPTDPEWSCKEVPESIVRVLDNEIGIEPYVSPSRRELLERRAMEAERLRLILLADDFREKALIRMMDGVLEVRWEDVIKKDVAKPPCMLTKDPEEYNVEDLVAVRQYEKDVDNLERERQRYKRLLEAELAKIKEFVRDSVDKFKEKFQELLVIRMKVEAAVQQLNLRALRGWIRHMYRVKAMSEDEITREEIESKGDVIKNLRDKLSILQGRVEAYRGEYEDLLVRERALRGKFRGEFPRLRKIFVEMLEKEYKRRPRTLLKSCTASDFLELGRKVGPRHSVAYLSHECWEYLRQLESLDVRPFGMPQNVEDHHWEHFIRLRRNMIEFEMKLRARLMVINETERAVAGFEEKIIKCQVDIDSLREKVDRMKRERVNFEKDLEVQLVLKMGQIELRLKGARDDAANALLVRRETIEVVNEAIRKAGKNKLRAMAHTINFRRGILCEEWQHQCLRMTITDLKEDMWMLENVAVTRDVREYLARSSKGFKDKTPQQLQRELEAARSNCEKRVGEWKARLEEVERSVIRTRRENRELEKKIESSNVDRWELEWQRDLEGESKQKEYHDRRMAVLVRRSSLVRKLQREYVELLAIQTEHELVRLRRFPNLDSYKTLEE